MHFHLYVLEFPNGKKYFGLSSNPSKRWGHHKKLSFGLSHFPVHLAIGKYGSDNVQFRILVIGSKPYIQQLEISAIEKFNTRDRAFGYNLSLGGETSPMLSAEVAAKVSATKKKRYAEDPSFRLLLEKQIRVLNTPENREKLNRAIRTPEVSAAKSRKLKGFKHTDETRANMSAAQRKPENRKDKSEKGTVAWACPILRAEQSARFKGRAVSSEQRAKISATLMGHPGFGKGLKRDPEICAKISASKIGHTVSPETRAKISATLKARDAAKKAAR